jgi:hypothetical protein
MEPPDGRRRVDSQHGKFLALLDQPDAERLDEGRLARPRHAGNTDPDGVTGLRQQGIQHLLGACW